MAEEFSRLEATLVDAARQGNVEHVIALLRDVGRLHHLWQPSSVQAAAIAKASQRVLRQPSADAGGTAAEHVTDLQVDDRAETLPGANGPGLASPAADARNLCASSSSSVGRGT